MSAEQVMCPPELAPLHGILAGKADDPFERMEQSAASQELTEQVDQIAWETWIGSDPRLLATGDVDGCGCPIMHWTRSDNQKSATMHIGCEMGYGAHIWSGTMMADLGLDGHVTRLNLAAALAGETIQQAAARVGIRLGERDTFTAITPISLRAEADDAEAAGDTETAKRKRAAADALEADGARVRAALVSLGQTVAPPEIRVTSPFIGAPVGESGEETEPGEGTGAAPASDGSSALAHHPQVEQRCRVETDETPAGQGVVIRESPGTAWENMPIPEDNELWKYPMPPRPPGVPEVQSPVTGWREVLPPIVSKASHPYAEYEWIFSATPGLSHVAAASDSRGVARWGMLGALLPRIVANIPPTVRLVPHTGERPTNPDPTDRGTSVNIYSVLVGPPGSGKTQTLSASDELVPGVTKVPVGTGEGILKLFPAGGEDLEDEDPSNDGAPEIRGLSERSNSSVLLSDDEIGSFISEMSRQGSKASTFYRSMWMGVAIGNITSDRERRALIDAHTYRFGIRLGAQPDSVAPLFTESGSGTPQRFLWLPTHLTVARGTEYPQTLQIARVNWFGGSPIMIPSVGGRQRPVWIEQPPLARKQMDEDKLRAAAVNPLSPTGRYDDNTPLDSADVIIEGHKFLNQLKIAVALAVLDGLAQPQDVHWVIAGVIMKVREHTVRCLVDVAQQIADAATKRKGRDQGLAKTHSVATFETETKKLKDDAVTNMILAIGDLVREEATLTRSKLVARAASHGNVEFIDDAFSRLIHEGRLLPVGDGTQYVFQPHSQGPSPDSSATVTVLKPVAAPVIGSL